MHAGTKVSDHITGSIEFCVGQTQGSDYPVASALRWAQRHKEYLILVVIDNVAKRLLELNLLRRIQVAFEHRELKVLAKIVTSLEHLPQAFVFGNVVTNQESRAHGSPRQQWNILGNLAGQGLGQQPRLQLQRPPIADFVVKQWMGNQRTHPLFIHLKEALAPRRR